MAHSGAQHRAAAENRQVRGCSCLELGAAGLGLGLGLAAKHSVEQWLADGARLGLAASVQCCVLCGWDGGSWGKQGRHSMGGLCVDLHAPGRSTARRHGACFKTELAPCYSSG